MKTVECELPKGNRKSLRRCRAKDGDFGWRSLRISVEERLARLDETFLDAADHVLSKNAELYKRLAW